MSKFRYGRLAAVASSALLALMLLGPTTVSAANTRLLYVGDPTLVSCDPLTATTGFTYNINCPTYLVHPTTVSAGNVTTFDVLLRNLGKQTLSSSIFGIGTLIANDNGLPGPQLPAGWTIFNYVPLSGATPTCTTDVQNGLTVGLSCDFGNLARGASASIRIFLTAGAARVADPNWNPCFDTLTGYTLNPCPALAVSGKVAEAVGGNVGSNNNTFYAYGDQPSSQFPGHSVTDYYVAGSGVDAGLFPKNTNHIEPSSHPGGPKPVTFVDLSTVSSDTLVYIDENRDATCPSGFTCLSHNGTFDTAAYASVNGGNTVSPYFTWNMQFPVDTGFKLSTQDGIYHLYSDGTSVFLFNQNKYSCGTGSTPKRLPCADFSVTVDSSGQWYMAVVLKTAKNGLIKAY